MLALREPIVGFGSCLKRILEKKGVSASELARVMHCKSRNTVFRILAGEGGYSALRAFCTRLFDEDPLSLSQDERGALEQALEVSRVGAESLRSYCELQALLCAMESVHAETDAGHSGKPDLSDIEAAVAGCREVNLIITGCCDVLLLRSLLALLRGLNRHTRMSIHHFIYTGAEEVIGNISAIQPLLYESCYTPYALESGMFSPERERLYRSNCIVLRARNAAGERFEQAFLLVDRGVFCSMSRRAPGGFRLLETIFSEDALLMHPIKKSFVIAEGAKAYVDYVLECERLEHRRVIYNIRPDVPISFIHPDMLVSAVLDGFRDKGFADDGDLRTILPPLYEAQMRRYNNFFKKRRPTHTILSREDMERFARTGEQSDHFFAMRTYTGVERVKILSHLRRQAEENPNFRLYFFRGDYTPPKMEVGLYEGVGVLFSKPHTDYNLSGDHAEAIIDQQEFCSRFREFFTQHLLASCVLSEAETLAVLDGLIRTAQKAI